MTDVSSTTIAFAAAGAASGGGAALTVAALRNHHREGAAVASAPNEIARWNIKMRGTTRVGIAAAAIGGALAGGLALVAPDRARKQLANVPLPAAATTAGVTMLATMAVPLTHRLPIGEATSRIAQPLLGWALPASSAFGVAGFALA